MTPRLTPAQVEAQSRLDENLHLLQVGGWLVLGRWVAGMVGRTAPAASGGRGCWVAAALTPYGLMEGSGILGLTGSGSSSAINKGSGNCGDQKW